MAFNTTSKRRETNKQEGKALAVPGTANAVFNKGDIVVSAGATGLAVPAFAAASGATGDCFVGVAMETKTFASSVTTADTILCDQTGIHDFDIAATTQAAAMGRPVYSESGATGTPTMVTLTAPAHAILIGYVVGLNSTTSVRVKIQPFTTVAA